MRRLLLALLLVLVLAAALLLARAARLPSRQPAPPAAAPIALADEAAALERLAAAIRIPTLSHQDPDRIEREAFEALHDHLAASFPRLHAALAREVVNELSLVYTWRGRDPDAPGVALLAHQDVVPVEPGTEEQWSQPPFAGAVDGGFVWGRGTLDTKNSLLALCEAVEHLLGEGFEPARTVYLVFGHDEEIGGLRGAKAVAERLAARGVRLAWVLDEGGAVTERMVPGVAAPVALVGIAEKGFLTLSVTARAEGGHSSVPPPHTAIGRLARAIQRIEANPMPAALRGATRHLFAWTAPEMDWPMRAVAANADLLEPLLVRVLARTPRGNALVRTTTAVTVVEGGVKENVLPSSARALVNFRLLPGDTIDAVLAHVREAVDDPLVEVDRYEERRGFSNEPSPVSRVDGAFAHLARTIRASHPDAVVAPNLVLGGTDARWFHALSEHVYRFSPLRLRPDDLQRIHGTDERIAVDHYLDAIRFYVRLLRDDAATP